MCVTVIWHWIVVLFCNFTQTIGLSSDGVFERITVNHGAAVVVKLNGIIHKNVFE